MNGQLDVEDPKKVWRNHCRSAVRKFVMNAVVIDNEPVLKTPRNEAPESAPKVAQKNDDGMAAPDDKKIAKEVPSSEKNVKNDPEKQDDESKNELNILELSDSFADQEITCAFVFPKDEDNSEDRYKRILAAALPADIVIIDWYLEDKKDPVLTKKVLRKIAEHDKAEYGRLRLICIYTGQSQTDEITRDAVKKLEEGGLKIDSDPQNGLAQGKHVSLLVLNKQDVDCKDLPNHILDAFTELADGLLPSFALAAVAAVRKNMHHIISRFSQDLDGAYVANRLITDTPGDAAELIRELFVSECDTALGLEKVADNYLEAEQIEKWLNMHKQPLTLGKYHYKEKGEEKTVIIDRDFLNCLLKKGLSGKLIEINGNEEEFDEKKREKISHSLHGGKKKAKQCEQEFARFVVLKREYRGNTKMESDEKWVPSLTLGTLLQQHDEDGEKFFYCLTPACDTLRLQGEKRTFLVLELLKAKGKTNLVIAAQEKENIRLFINPRPTNIRPLRFMGSETTGRVMAERSEKDGRPLFTFKTVDNDPIELTWIGEVRKHRANRDMANLNRMWLRFGINDSEYLRLAGKGAASM